VQYSGLTKRPFVRGRKLFREGCDSLTDLGKTPAQWNKVCTYFTRSRINCGHSGENGKE